MLITIWRLCDVLWKPDGTNFNAQMQNVSASHRPLSQSNAKRQSSFQSSLSGDRGDFDSREVEDVDDLVQKDLIRVQQSDPDENVANAMIADFSLIKSWIQEMMPGQEGNLVAGRFRNEVKGFGCRV
jgi:hypothetical protein